MHRLRVAFDLDETLGAAITDGQSVIGFQLREGCQKLIDILRSRVTLILWTVSYRRYVEKALSREFLESFEEVYTWTEKPCDWKDIRSIQANYLVDDSLFYKEEAKKHGIDEHYIIVPAYGSMQDKKEPLLWCQMVLDSLPIEID